MENEEKYSILDWIVSIASVIVPIFFIISVVGVISYPVYLKYKADKADYDEYGCYRVVKEYELCGPVEGKPGFTACETKKKKVCPDQE